MVTRLAVAADAEAIGAVHVRAWQQTYAGLMPAALLAGLDPMRRAAEWRERLDRGAAVGVALDGEALLGFACWGDRRDASLDSGGEIHAIYVLAEAQRRGIGRALMAMAASGLTARGHVSAGLWVLASNGGARAFYQTLGGRPGAQRDEVIAGVTHRHVAYRWHSLAPLLLAGDPSPARA